VGVAVAAVAGDGFFLRAEDARGERVGAVFERGQGRFELGGDGQRAFGALFVVAIALATGNFSDVDIDQYLTGEAVNRADEIIASGADANASSIARFGTVHHATTLNSFEKAEYSWENGRTMLTVITFGWDAPPDSSDLPEFTGASMVPGSPGTLAWYMTIDDTGLIDGIWTESEVGDYD